MIITPFTQWQTWNGRYSMLPYIEKHDVPAERPVSWEPYWRLAGREAFVLESGKAGRYTFFGCEPVSILAGKADKARIWTPGRSDVREKSGVPLQMLKEWMAGFRAPRVAGAPKFSGGCVGFLGYDVVRFIERLPVLAKDDLGIPDYAMMRFNRVWILDHEERALYCAVYTEMPAPRAAGERELAELYAKAAGGVQDMLELWRRLEEANRSGQALRNRQLMQSAIAEDLLYVDPERMSGITAAFAKRDFMRAIERIQAYIAQGDVFQVNLSVRQSRELHTGPERVYEWLRALNPSPYMGVLKLPDFELVCGSPELLVQLNNGRVRTRPIAGTRKRGATREDDERLVAELIGNEKERAEHIMLVDLERNDLGRISRYGTVKVTELMAVEYYSHVMHIVSEVTGELADGKDAYDVIRAVFPGGTITGAPKVRTMEIIEELEPVRRGPYTGAIGWIDYTGDMELNIVIRTMLAVGGKAHIQAGAGIVIDSVAEREYKEAINKAKALWKAIEYSERVPLAPPT